MIINSNILKSFIKVPENILELTNKYIVEVDAYAKINSSTNLTVGYVLTCKPHPDSDHLNVTTVDVGNEVLQIVCGASNVAQGQYVIVARVGAILPGNFEIKAAKIRGVESAGMICSLKELGFDEKNMSASYASGIYAFETPQRVGSNPLDLLGQDGFLMTLGLTPNRGDLLSHYGFALDLGAVLNQKISLPTFDIEEIEKKNPIKIRIDALGCLSYYARKLDVTIKESPWWLKSALISAGIRPINNVVDITNYVLIEYGTPLHAFDADKFGSDVVAIRYAKDDEAVVTLDDQTRHLKSSDVVITNGMNVVAVAGVMGLSNTIVDEKTSSIVLEAACFDEKHIQATSKRLNLRSESSHRFERGVDDKRVLLGLQRATELFIELADAKVYQGISSLVNIERTIKPVSVSSQLFTRRLGQNFSPKVLEAYFQRLNYTYEVMGKTYSITRPSYRLDLNIPADFIEEIGRIYGFDHIKNKPLFISKIGALTPKQKVIRGLRHQLSALGFNETINYSLISDEELRDFYQYGDVVTLLKPMSEYSKHMRQSLLPGLLKALAYNSNRGIKQQNIYEIGSVYSKHEENVHLSVLATGAFIQTTWLKQNVNHSIHLLKGVLQQISVTLGQTFDLEQVALNWLHPGLSAHIKHKEEVIGYIGKLHPSYAKKYDLAETYGLEVNLTPILKEPNTQLVFESISKYPSVTRDISFVVSTAYQVGDIEKLIRQTARKILVELELFDVYSGSHVALGHQSLAFRLTFNDRDKTLESADVDKTMKSIKNRLQFTFKAEIRD